MRVGIVSAWFESGAGYVSKALYESLAQRHEVHVFARGGEEYAPLELKAAQASPRWNWPNVTWAKQGIPFVITSIDLPQFRSWLEANAIELVLFNEQWHWPPIVLCNQLNIMTGTYVDYYTEDTVPFFDAYDFLICNTMRHASVFAWHPQSLYIPWGTDLKTYFPAREGQLETHEQVTFFHSAMHAPGRKGTDVVLLAFDALSSSSRLIIHAKEDPAVCFPHLRDLINRLVRDQKLVIHTETVPAPGLYHLGNVYVYPTRLEGIGLTVVEALACGLPVIVPDCAPMNEFVVHGKNGRLVAVERFVARSDGYYWPKCYVALNDLIDQMKFYIANAPELPRLGAAARTFAESHLDWQKSSSELPVMMSQLRKRNKETLLAAARKAVAYHAARAPVYQQFPRAYRLARSAKKLISMRWRAK